MFFFSRGGEGGGGLWLLFGCAHGVSLPSLAPSLPSLAPSLPSVADAGEIDEVGIGVSEVRSA